LEALNEQSRKLALQIIQNEVRSDRIALYNRSMNLDHTRKVCFVHNPKCMGTSLKGWLGLPVDNADHRFPTLMVNRLVWESYTTIAVVRHPVARFVSSYHFHCTSDYAGGYLSKYPDLKKWDMETYFQNMTTLEPYALAPQWKYTFHLRSEQAPDFLIKMEEAELPLRRLGERLRIKAPMPDFNRSTGAKIQPPESLVTKLQDYYQRDFALFGY
jgi:hypothetical protein